MRKDGFESIGQAVGYQLGAVELRVNLLLQDESVDEFKRQSDKLRDRLVPVALGNQGEALVQLKVNCQRAEHPFIISGHDLKREEGPFEHVDLSLVFGLQRLKVVEVLADYLCAGESFRTGQVFAISDEAVVHEEDDLVPKLDFRGQLFVHLCEFVLDVLFEEDFSDLRLVYHKVRQTLNRLEQD